MTDIWKEILKLDKVGINDNFFDLGGTSFGILKLMRKSMKCLTGIFLWFPYSGIPPSGR